MTVLTVNVGSSSVKLRWLEGEGVVSSVDLSAGGSVAEGDLSFAVTSAVSASPPPEVVVHRIVHGGNRFREGVLIDDDVLLALRELSDLAPDHQRRALSVIDTLGSGMPDVPHVAVFDTAFHSTLGPAATTLAIPAEWREAWGVRRFGFHGLSHAYSSRRALELLGQRHGRVVVAHLGSGCSLAATVDGQSVETTMGFTPLDGLVMGTRSGSVDPGLIPWLQVHHGVSSARALEALEHESGLLALAGTSDMREVMARCRRGPEPDRAQLAVEVFVHRLVLSIGAMAAAAGGMDALVFTGGIGENSAQIRGATAARLGHLGVHIDEERNANLDTYDRDIAEASAPCRVHVVRAREEVQMVRASAGVLERASAGLRASAMDP
ncbi:acetate kinase [Janibacter sp. HTCC2649]|uniref:acetate/propionate family kinase n=1 Tax=Janibacter sp. HTCC2649 TaxID=313589 RepID=UPI000066EBEC|nr:acetate/propionate family kinase [Janibacter sp. HTCC2649]EAP98927.1 acetate kinase [Janibacter sp. HTCC2649]